MPYTGSLQALHQPDAGSIRALCTLYTCSVHALYTSQTHSTHALYTLYTRPVHALYKLYTRAVPTPFSGNVDSFILDRPLVAALSNGKAYPPREGRYMLYIERRSYILTKAVHLY